MAITFTKSYFLSLDLAQKLHNLNGDVLRIALTLTAPVQGTTHVLSDLTQIANGNGYTTAADGAGETCGASICASQSSGASAVTVTTTNHVWTSSGAGMAAFRYVVLWNDTSAGNDVLGWWDYGSTLTLAVGETFTADLSAGICTVGF